MRCKEIIVQIGRIVIVAVAFPCHADCLRLLLSQKVDIQLRRKLLPDLLQGRLLPHLKMDACLGSDLHVSDDQLLLIFLFLFGILFGLSGGIRLLTDDLEQPVYIRGIHFLGSVFFLVRSFWLR